MVRAKRLGLWLLMTPFSTGMLWGGTFPTDSHPPTLETARDLLHAVCPADATVMAGAQGVNSGCKSCPGIVPGGSTFNSADANSTSYSLESVMYGNFTRAGVQEAVASFSGCEPHADNFGGSILLEKTPTGWKVKSYESGFISDECLKYRLKSGRDLLLCQGGYGGQGEIDSSLFTFDYALPKQQHSKTLLSTRDTVSTCLPGDKTVGSIEGVQLRDLNHDGMSDVVVTVKAAKVKPPAGHEQDCGESLVLPMIKTRELDFLFGEDTFKIAPGSAETKRELDSLFAQ